MRSSHNPSSFYSPLIRRGDFLLNKRKENIFALSCENAGQINKYSYSIDEEGKLVIAEEYEVIDYKAQVAEFETVRTEMDNKLKTDENRLDIRY